MRTSNFASLFSCGFFLLFISFASCIDQTPLEKEKPAFTWTINDIKNQKKPTNFTLLSEVFPLKGYSFGAQAQLKLDENNYLWISLAYKDLNNSGRALNLEIIPSVTYTYKDQQQPSRDIIRHSNCLFPITLKFDEFNYDSWILPFENITSDTISIDIWVEGPEEAVKGYSHNGTLSWTIDNFRQKREMQVEHLVGAQVSPYFYTSPRGYRVQALIWLNGYGKYRGKGLTMSIAFLTGLYDVDLSGSFKQMTTVTLFHPTDPTKQVVKSSDASTYQYMISMGTLEEIEPLLVNDTLYCRIKIVPA